MKLRYATGSGSPPCFVRLIQGSRNKGSVLLEGSSELPNKIQFSSQGELVDICKNLTNRNIAFSVGGHVPGPAEEMDELQSAGLFISPYLRISWSRPGIWLIHEILPDYSPPWQLVSVDELLKSKCA
jgi:hypothetical protein